MQVLPKIAIGWSRGHGQQYICGGRSHRGFGRDVRNSSGTALQSCFATAVAACERLRLHDPWMVAPLRFAMAGAPGSGDAMGGQVGLGSDGAAKDGLIGSNLFRTGIVVLLALEAWELMIFTCVVLLRLTIDLLLPIGD